jgi:hypothetical protein
MTVEQGVEVAAFLSREARRTLHVAFYIQETDCRYRFYRKQHFAIAAKPDFR